MAQWEHGGGFSVDASVRIAAADRAGRERLLRYCTRPLFALVRPRELDPERLLDESTKPGPGGNGPLLLLTPLELLDRLASLVPPPRVHRHRCFATSVCSRERPLTRKFRGDTERQELARKLPFGYDFVSGAGARRLSLHALSVRGRLLARSCVVRSARSLARS